MGIDPENINIGVRGRYDACFNLIHKKNGKWEIFYGEQGKKFDAQLFGTQEHRRPRRTQHRLRRPADGYEEKRPPARRERFHARAAILPLIRQRVGRHRLRRDTPLPHYQRRALRQPPPRERRPGTMRVLVQGLQNQTRPQTLRGTRETGEDLVTSLLLRY